jgi:hypothetical protein
MSAVQTAEKWVVVWGTWMVGQKESWWAEWMAVKWELPMVAMRALKLVVGWDY